MRRLTLTPNHSLQEQWTSCADPSATRPGDAGFILHDRTNSIDAICCAYMLLPCSALFRAQKLLHLAWLASARASAQAISAHASRRFTFPVSLSSSIECTPHVTACKITPFD